MIGFSFDFIYCYYLLLTLHKHILADYLRGGSHLLGKIILAALSGTNT